jgi:hypothetical protein
MLIIFTINLVILGLVWPAQITFFSWTVGVTKCPSWMCVAREDTLPDFHLTPWGRPNGAIRCDCNSRGGGRTKQYVASLWSSKPTAGPTGQGSGSGREWRQGKEANPLPPTASMGMAEDRGGRCRWTAGWGWTTAPVQQDDSNARMSASKQPK